MKRLRANLTRLSTHGRGGSGPFHQQPSSESRLLSESRSGAGESTHEAQRLVCTDFTEWGYYLNQIRDAKKPEQQVQQKEEATRPEREHDNSRGSNEGRNISSNLFVKHRPPAAAGCCFPKGLSSSPAPSSSPAEQEQGSEADFQCCRQIPSFEIHHPMLLVEHPVALPAPQLAPAGAWQEPTPHLSPPGLCPGMAQTVSNWKPFQPHLFDLEGKLLSEQQVLQMGSTIQALP